MRPSTAHSIRAGVCTLDWKAQPARTWLAVVLLVALAHAGAWLGLERLRDAAKPTQSFQVIEAALLPPPPAPMPRLLPVAPPRPKKAMPPPRPAPAPPQHVPAPLPVAAPVLPAAEPPAVQIVAAAPEPEPAPAEPEAPPSAPPAPAPVPPPPPPPVMIEAPRFNAAYLNNPSPAYPAAARRRGQEGRVLVRAEVLADGRCSRVELKQGSGHELLDQAALDAVRKWRFVPARQGEQAVTAWVDVPIAFKLKN